MSERDIQVSIVNWLRLVLPRGSVVWAVKNEHAAKATTTAGRMRFFQKRKAEGVLAGIPDVHFVIPGPRLLMIETKTAAGVVSANQQIRHEELRALGVAVGIAVDIDSARGFLSREGVALRETAGQPTRVAKVRFAKRLVDDEMPF